MKGKKEGTESWQRPVLEKLRREIGNSIMICISWTWKRKLDNKKILKVLLTITERTSPFKFLNKNELRCLSFFN